MARITGSDAKKLYELYDSIYEMKECEHQEENFEHVLEEEDLQEYDVRGAVKGALDKGAKFMKTNPVGKAVSAVLKPVGKGRGTVTKAENEKRIQQNQDVDLFDLIKGHLIDEGYAETEEAALAIMANMTEEWRNEIVEQSSARSREFEKKLPAERGSRGREFEHGSTRSAGTPSGNLADKSPRDPKTGKLMY
jgi:hypothetical protein